MGVRIQELPATSGIKKEDVLIVEDGQGTKKGTVQQLDETLGVSQLKEELAKKVTQIEGKQLSTNDYSTAEKNKLASLNNYDDSAIVKQLKELSDRVNGISMSITALSVTDGVLKMSVDVQEGGKQ